MRTQNDTDGHPLNLMPGWFLAISLIATLKDDPFLDVTGTDAAVADIRSRNPDFALGTGRDVDHRFRDAMRIVSGQIADGRLGVALSERALTQNDPSGLLVPGSVTRQIAQVAAIFGDHLHLWCGKPNPVDA